MPKLFYITNGITGSGGLERVLSVKASMLAEKLGYEVHIMTINEEVDEKPFFSFSDKIVRHNIFLSGNPIKYFQNYKSKIKEIVKKIDPEIIIVCDDGLKGFYIPKILKPKIPIIYERHASVNISIKGNFISRLAKKAKHFLMLGQAKKFSKFVVLTNSNLKEWGNAKNLVVIPNPVSFYPEESSTLLQKKVIAVGSQGYNKGTDLLLNIWKKAESDFPDWKLEIYGKPHPEKIFEHQAKQLNLKDFKFFPAVENIMEKYLDSSVLVLTSRSEGFGMVLIEAMSCGLPCVSFDCPHGPKDIVANGEDGFLVSERNVEEFYGKLKTLMHDFELRKKMGAKAKDSAKKYLPQSILKQWDDLFKNICYN